VSKVRIPAEIEEALWTVAESNDPRAIDEFGKRYPAYKEALIDRIQMVRRLRSSRPLGEAPAMKFRPAPAPTPRRWPALALGGLLFAGLAWGTVSNWPAPRKQPDSPVQSSSVAGPTSEPTTDGRGSPLALAPGDHKVESGPSHEDVGKPETVAAPSDPFERPVTVDHGKVKLTALLREIGMQAKLKLEVAPGLEDVEIEAHYAATPAKDVLRDLGDNFGFTVMVQEGSHALVIPALDERSGPTGGAVPSGQGSGPVRKLVPNDSERR